MFHYVATAAVNTQYGKFRDSASISITRRVCLSVCVFILIHPGRASATSSYQRVYDRNSKGSSCDAVQSGVIVLRGERGTVGDKRIYLFPSFQHWVELIRRCRLSTTASKVAPVVDPAEIKKQNVRQKVLAAKDEMNYIEQQLQHQFRVRANPAAVVTLSGATLWAHALRARGSSSRRTATHGCWLTARNSKKIEFIHLAVQQ